MESNQITRDYFYKRRVIVHQHKSGYRFSIDAPILAHFLPHLPGQDALEVGTGSGIISLLTLYKNKFKTITALDIQPRLCDLAKKNSISNHMEDRLNVICGDFKEIHKEFSGIRHIFSNPPYFPVHRGRLSPNPEIRDAKSETQLTLEQLMKYSCAVLGKEGNVYMVLPAERFELFMNLAERFHFHVARLRRVFSFKDGRQERFLVQLTNYSVSQEDLPPLIIFKDKGVYTEEMDRLLTG